MGVLVTVCVTTAPEIVVMTTLVTGVAGGSDVDGASVDDVDVVDDLADVVEWVVGVCMEYR